MIILFGKALFDENSRKNSGFIITDNIFVLFASINYDPAESGFGRRGWLWDGQNYDQFRPKVHLVPARIKTTDQVVMRNSIINTIITAL